MGVLDAYGRMGPVERVAYAATFLMFFTLFFPPTDWNPAFVMDAGATDNALPVTVERAKAHLAWTTGGATMIRTCLSDAVWVQPNCVVGTPPTEADLNAAWNIPQGSSRILTWDTDDAVGVPNLPTGDDASDLCRLTAVWDNGGTVQRTFHSATTCPADGTTFELFPTSNGLAGGTPTAGTARVRIEVRDFAAGIAVYQVDSDVDTGNSDPEKKGAFRYAMDVSAIDHGGYPPGVCEIAPNVFAVCHAYTVAGEVITWTVTHTQANANQATRNVVFRVMREGATCSTGTEIESGTQALDADGSTVRTSTVSDAYPAVAGEDVGLRFDAPGNAALTGLDWTYFTGAFACGAITAADTLHGRVQRADFVTVDARITATHLLQVNDNAFGTPPLSKNVACACRLTADLGFLATRFTNARGEGLVGASFAFSQTLQDSGALTPPDTATGLGVATQGAQAGWGALRTWDAALPRGSWTKTVDATAPASIDSNAHLLVPTAAYSLLAPDPNVTVGIDASPFNSGDTGLFRPGVGLEASVFAVDAGNREPYDLDATPVPRLALTRSVGDRIQFLDTGTNDWRDLSDGPVEMFRLSLSPDGFSWTTDWPAANTTTWGTFDVSMFARFFIDGVPYGGQTRITSAFGGNVTTPPGANLTAMLDVSPATVEGERRVARGEFAINFSLYAYDSGLGVFLSIENDTVTPFVVVTTTIPGFSGMLWLGQGGEWVLGAPLAEPYRWNLTEDLPGASWSRVLAGNETQNLTERDLTVLGTFEDSNGFLRSVSTRITLAQAIMEDDTVNVNFSEDPIVLPTLFTVAFAVMLWRGWLFPAIGAFLGAIGSQFETNPWPLSLVVVLILLGLWLQYWSHRRVRPLAEEKSES